MFDLQKLTFFTEGNTFTGSRSEGEKLLRYRAEPKDEELLAWCWREDKCFEAAGGKEEKRFLLNQKGLDEMLVWLEEAWERGE